MESIRNFLAHAIRLEATAARHSDELADAMQTWGNTEIEAFFRRMANYSRLHLKVAMDRAGFRYLTDLPEDGYIWPNDVPPESVEWWGVDGLMGIDQAIELAIEGEKRGLAYYEHVAQSTHDAKVRAMAEEFVVEETEHVSLLEQLLQSRLNSEG